MQKKTLHIEGMSCGHCESHVKKALENVDGVREAVENEDYQVLGSRKGRHILTAYLTKSAPPMNSTHAVRILCVLCRAVVELK